MATTYTPPTINYTVTKYRMVWNADGTRTLTLAYSAPGVATRYEDITLNATNALDRFGNVLIAQLGAFQTAMSTIEADIDSAIASLQAAGKLNPP